MAKIWIYSDSTTVLTELIAGARELGGEDPAVIISANSDLAQEVVELGVTVYHLAPGGEMPEDYVESIESLVRQEQPAGLFFGYSVSCRAIAARLAARLGINAFSDVKFMDSDFIASQLVYGGSAYRRIKTTAAQFIAIFPPSVFAPDGVRRKGAIIEAPYSEPAKKIELLSVKKREAAEAVDLAAAKRIVVVGRGLEKQEDLGMVYELASLLGAEVGCSRPISEGNGWLPKDRYIGISGVFVKPDLLVSLGISGQVQHAVGIGDANTIVVINKDPDCMMQKHSDYSIASDLYEFVPALIEQLKKCSE